MWQLSLVWTVIRQSTVHVPHVALCCLDGDSFPFPCSIELSHYLYVVHKFDCLHISINDHFKQLFTFCQKVCRTLGYIALTEPFLMT